MHELGIMYRVLDLALETARKNGGVAVTAVKLRVGVLSGVLPGYLASFFEMISKETPAEGAVLMVETEAAEFTCLDCGENSVFEAYGSDFRCLHCGGDRVSLRSGSGFQVVDVAIRGGGKDADDGFG